MTTGTNQTGMSPPKLVLFESEIEKQAGLVAGRIAGRTADGAMDIAGNIVGGLIGDRIREWRTRNLVSSLSRTADFLRAKGIPLDKTRALPMGEAYAMFEEASKQDDPTVQEMWSALLANAMDAGNDVRIEPAFVSTLRVIGGLEARVLRFDRDFQRERVQAFKSLPRSLTVQFKASKEDLELTKRIEQESRAKQHEFNSEMKRRFDENVGNIQENSLNDALTLLVKERCLCVPAPTFSDRKLTTISRFSDLGPLEMLDASKVEDALNEISASVDEHSGYPGMLPDLLKRETTWAKDGTFMLESNYGLTSYGERLLEACEPSG